MLLVNVVFPIGWVVYQIYKNGVGAFDFDLPWARGSNSNSDQPSTHMDQIVITDVPKTKYAADGSDEVKKPDIFFSPFAPIVSLLFLPAQYFKGTCTERLD